MRKGQNSNKKRAVDINRLDKNKYQAKVKIEKMCNFSSIKKQNREMLLCLLTAAAATAAKSLQSCWTLCDCIDGSPPGSPFLGFSRQENWNALPFPSPVHESEK